MKIILEYLSHSRSHETGNALGFDPFSEQNCKDRSGRFEDLKKFGKISRKIGLGIGLA